MSHRFRSLLFTPATRPERFAKAVATGADLLIVDLEDAVGPSDKTEARQTLLDTLANHGRRADAPPIAVRINSPDSAEGLRDVLAMIDRQIAPDWLVVPKCEAAATLVQIDRLLSAARLSCRLMPLIESAAGMACVNEIARAVSRVGALMLGSADLAADLGCVADAPQLDNARLRLVEAGVLAGRPIVDSPFFDLQDNDGLARAAHHAQALGMTGKAAIHPAQIDAINTAFTPTAAEVVYAHQVLDANRAGVGVVDGQMVDEALARSARRVLDRAGESPNA